MKKLHVRLAMIAGGAALALLIGLFFLGCSAALLSPYGSAINDNHAMSKDVTPADSAQAQGKIPYEDIMRYPTAWPEAAVTGPATALDVKQPVCSGQRIEKMVLREAASPTAQPFIGGYDPSEELWVIERNHDNAQPAVASADQPGEGQLVAKEGTQIVPVPLKHTDVHADISGYFATVHVKQQYQNPFSEKIEAVYVFPLPENAAVNDFVMRIGERKIRGIIRERAEAEKIYTEARSQGYVASLMTQERPNIFTQKVANIEPGKAIDIDIQYFHTLVYTDGWYVWHFPMVVGPRFNPPEFSDGVGTVARGDKGASGQKTEVQYLAPNERSGQDISLSAHIDAGVNIEQIDCNTHKIGVAYPGAAQADVTLAASDSIPNRDFVLRFKVAGETVKSAILTQRDESGKGGYFTLMLYPPASIANLPRKPLEMVFTVDVSGSQSGEPLAQEKAAVRYALQHMTPDDTFQVVKFGDSATRLFDAPVPVDEQNVSRALSYVDGFEAGGGTMLVDGLRASLNFPHDPQRMRFVQFLTDGFIGNEKEALGEIHNDLGASRIFSFGVGSSTNRFLLDHMARMGNGLSTYLGLHDNADEVMAEFFSRIGHPAMTDLTADWGKLAVSDVYPRELPDLFVGRPVIITGRFTGGGAGVVHIHGKAFGEDRDIAVPVNFDDPADAHPGIASIWARTKIADLGDRAIYEGNAEIPQQIKTISLDYNLLSAYTAFVAVDSTIVTAGDHGTSVVAPVNMPEGVRYETTVLPPGGAAGTEK